MTVILNYLFWVISMLVVRVENHLVCLMLKCNRTYSSQNPNSPQFGKLWFIISIKIIITTYLINDSVHFPGNWITLHKAYALFTLSTYVSIDGVTIKRKFKYSLWSLYILYVEWFFSLKLHSSRSASNRPLRATCTKTAAHTWHAEAIWTLLLFWTLI